MFLILLYDLLLGKVISLYLTPCVTLFMNNWLFFGNLQLVHLLDRVIGQESGKALCFKSQLFSQIIYVGSVNKSFMMHFFTTSRTGVQYLLIRPMTGVEHPVRPMLLDNDNLVLRLCQMPFVSTVLIAVCW